MERMVRDHNIVAIAGNIITVNVGNNADKPDISTRL